MNWFDFFIGFTLMNAMPHFVLGVWGGRMLTAFGFGNTANIAYGFLNFIVSLSLFSYKYGMDTIVEHPIYVGAVVVLLIYFITAKPLFSLFTKKQTKE